MSLTPEQFIEDWYEPHERWAARKEFERAGLLAPEPRDSVPAASVKLPDWWADYEPPSALVYQFKKVGNW